ncbi:MAG: LEA type 2 family protein [Bdellovibrionota bacterium]
MKTIAYTQITACLFLMASCTFLRETIGIKPTPPIAKVESIRLQSFDHKKIKLYVKIRVDNPNIFDLDFSNLTYDISVTDSILASGKLVEDISIASKGHSNLHLPINIEIKEAAKILQLLFVKKQQVTAKIVASAEFLSPIGNISINFQDEKTIK